MQQAKHDISFRPVTAADLTKLRAWMEQAHWREWWGDTETELGYIADMIEGRDTTRPFVFQVDGVDFGYIQYWKIGDNLMEPWLSQAPWMTALPKHTIGVDLSIGDEKDVSKGVGSAVLKAFAKRLVEQGHEKIIIDPDCRNKRAVRAYEKAGFRAIEALLGKTGDTLLMQFDANSVIEGDSSNEATE